RARCVPAGRWGPSLAPPHCPVGVARRSTQACSPENRDSPSFPGTVAARMGLLPPGKEGQSPFSVAAPADEKEGLSLFSGRRLAAPCQASLPRRASQSSSHLIE